jgi:hypothetical protein
LRHTAADAKAKAAECGGRCLRGRRARRAATTDACGLGHHHQHKQRSVGFSSHTSALGPALLRWDACEGHWRTKTPLPMILHLSSNTPILPTNLRFVADLATN